MRGYWLADLEPIFRRYPPPEVVQVGQLVQEKPHNDLAVPLVPVVPVVAGEKPPLPDGPPKGDVWEPDGGP